MISVLGHNDFRGIIRTWVVFGGIICSLKNWIQTCGYEQKNTRYEQAEGCNIGMYHLHETFITKLSYYFFVVNETLFGVLVYANNDFRFIHIT